MNGLVSLVFQNIKLLKYTCRIDRKLKPDPKNIGYASWTCCDYALKNPPLQCSTYRAVLIMWDHYLISVSQQNFEEKTMFFSGESGIYRKSQPRSGQPKHQMGIKASSLGTSSQTPKLGIHRNLYGICGKHTDTLVIWGNPMETSHGFSQISSILKL